MRLYHGSNVIVNKIIQNDRALDFGKDFYLTTDFEQAKKWAILVKERRNDEKAYVSTFEINDFDKLKVLKFETANRKWLDFVCSNRKRL